MAKNASLFNGPQSKFATDALSLVQYVSERIDYDNKNQLPDFLHMLEDTVKKRYIIDFLKYRLRVLSFLLFFVKYQVQRVEYNFIEKIATKKFPVRWSS